jgi:predicted acylesterase/phospholipase RssA
MAKPLTLFTLPISGGLFPIQIGILSAISDANGIMGFNARVKPDIVFSSSGGNVAAYVGASSDWEKARMYAAMNVIRTEAFLTTWSVYVPSWVFLPFEKAIFRPGYGFRQIFHHFFPSDESLAAATEIWTGTMHSKSRQHRVFTNKKEGETRIEPLRIRPGGYDSGAVDAKTPSTFNFGDNLAPIYASGNRDMIADASLASASIPLFVKPVRIGGEDYCDGGTVFSSPMSQLADATYKAFVNATLVSQARMVYISSSPVQSYFSQPLLVGDLAAIIGSIRNLDIAAFISVIVRLGADRNSPSVKTQVNAKGLADIFTALNSGNKHYAVLLFPHEKLPAVDLVDIKPAETRRLATIAEMNIDAIIWQVP